MKACFLITIIFFPIQSITTQIKNDILLHENQISIRFLKVMDKQE